MSARHRRGAPPPDSEYVSSSDEEDAFAALKSKKPRTNKSVINKEVPVSSALVPSNVPLVSGVSECQKEVSDTMADRKNPVKVSITSSMKRHHGEISSSRKAKMDALLQELDAEKKTIIAKQKRHSNHRVSGSFVQPGEEHITTNLFVGNLAPCLTEEQVYDVFVQFGSLHSVKIMWARTPEERSRNRHSGFVCFRHRPDAEAAMNELDDTDPFRVGRYIMVRWGRHVPHHDEEIMSSRANGEGASGDRIHVTRPTDSERERYLSTFAATVARVESPLEEKLKHDPDFACSDAERLYYRWRVWSFAHGASETSWRTEPFTMQEGGPMWIPPPLHQLVDTQISSSAARTRSLDLRRRHGGNSDGRELTSLELGEFNLLFRKQLTTSRGAICKAMAFCFDKSGSFRHICDLLQEILQEEPSKDIPKDVAMEQKTAQLFLLSDILFNSQQPGVRNAFRYRDAIEKMAPVIFTALGKMDWGGRLTRNKLAVEISAILGAWTNWSVYSPWFLDELQDRFEGRSVKPKENEMKMTSFTTDDDHRHGDDDNKRKAEGINNETDPRPISHDEFRDCTSKGDWAVIEPLSETQNEAIENGSNAKGPFMNNAFHTERTQTNDLEGGSYVDGDRVDTDDDIDGEPLEDDVEDISTDKGVDGDPFDDIDGESIEDDNVDGEALDDENIDGEPIEE